MRLAIILNREEAAAHEERQARRPELLDPDPEQRALTEVIERAVIAAHGEIDEGRAVEAIDLYAEAGGAPDEITYLYTLIGEPP